MLFKKIKLIRMRFLFISPFRENLIVCMNNHTWMDSRYYVTLEKHLMSADEAIVYTTGVYFVATVQFEGYYYYDASDIVKKAIRNHQNNIMVGQAWN